MILVQRGSGGNQTTEREYLLTDAQGSTCAVLDDYGMPINASARMSFDPFGQRRIAIGEQAWEAPMPWSITLRVCPTEVNLHPFAAVCRSDVTRPA